MKMWLTRMVLVSLALLGGHAIGWQERTKGLAWSHCEVMGEPRFPDDTPDLTIAARPHSARVLVSNQFLARPVRR